MKLTGENQSARRKTCPSATLSTTNPIWTEPGSNPGLRGGRPAANRLSHCTANPEVTFWAKMSPPPHTHAHSCSSVHPSIHPFPPLSVFWNTIMIRKTDDKKFYFQKGQLRKVNLVNTLKDTDCLGENLTDTIVMVWKKPRYKPLIGYGELYYSGVPYTSATASTWEQSKRMLLQGYDKNTYWCSSYRNATSCAWTF
jgi:hypothetical protein